MLLVPMLVHCQTRRGSEVISKVQTEQPGTISKAQAEQIVLEAINKRSEHEMVLLRESTIEKEYGWIFFYTTKKYHETGDSKHLVPGNGPVVVMKGKGSVHFLGSFHPTVEIENFEVLHHINTSKPLCPEGEYRRPGKYSNFCCPNGAICD